MDRDHNFNKTKDTMNPSEEKESLSSENGGNDVRTEEDDVEDSDICSECGFEPCVFFELEEMLVAIKQSHMDEKTNNQIRFIMYRESITHIFGRGLGEGNRKRVPKCVERKIKAMCPSAKYKGFQEAKSDN